MISQGTGLTETGKSLETLDLEHIDAVLIAQESQLTTYAGLMGRDRP
jgi:hypothetical protein